MSKKWTCLQQPPPQTPPCNCLKIFASRHFACVQIPKLIGDNIETQMWQIPQQAIPRVTLSIYHYQELI